MIIRKGLTLLEVLVACLIAGVFLFPIARFLYKSSWNQAAIRRFQAEWKLDSLMRSGCAALGTGDSSVLKWEDAGGTYLVSRRTDSDGLLLIHGVWKDARKGPGRDLWIARTPCER